MVLMKRNRKTDKRIVYEVERTLELIEEPQSVSTDSYFYTRLKARMQNPGGKNLHKRSVISVLQPAFLFLLLAVNIFTVYYIFKQDSSAQAQQSFADEYNLVLNSTELFDITTQQEGE